MHKSILLASAALGLSASSAMAQTAGDRGAAPAASSDNGLAEILVTATKRTSNLQNVPVAVTAITSETIQNQRITEFGDLTRAAASLTLTESTASPNNAIILRGIGTYAFSIGVEPSVAVIIDDVPVVQQAQAFDNMSDVKSIEVLRGPQGTLFGKNASAGAINIVTQDVANTLAYSAAVTASTDRDYKGEASVSAPLSDAGGIQLSGYYNNYAGNVRNLTTGALLNDQESWGIHGKLKFEVSPKLTILLNGVYSNEHNNGTATPIRYVDVAGYNWNNKNGSVGPQYNHVSLAPDLIGITPGSGNYNVYQDNPGYTNNAQATFSGKATYDLGFASLISVTSYQDWKFNFAADVDGTDLNVNGTGVPVTSPVGPAQGVNQSGPYHSTEFTQELRLTSKGAGPLSYVAGLYYADAATHRSFARGPTQALAEWNGYQATRSMAAFAGLDYKLPTKTTISAAARINNEHIQDFFEDDLPSHNATPAVAAADCGIGAANCAGSHNDTAITWKGSISQELAPHVSAYGSVATGYKGYAYDISSGYGPTRTANPVQAEHSTSYELGLKSRFLDNKVQLNIAGFYTDYNNFQAQSSQFVVIDGSTVLQQKLNNVGKLRTKGIEVDAMARPAKWLHLDGSFAYTDAKVVSFPNAACYSGQLQTGTGCGPSTNPTGLGNVQDRSGSQLPNSPKFKFNLGATFEGEMANGMRDMFTLTYQHQSSVNFDLLGSPYDTQQAYGLMNASVGLEKGPYKVSIFVNNLFDTHYAVGLSEGFGSYGVHYITQVMPRDSQRYAGIKLGAKF